MKLFSPSRHEVEPESQPIDTRVASRAASKGKPQNSFSFDALPNHCCVYRDSRGCACALSTRHMNQPHTDATDGHGGIDDD